MKNRIELPEFEELFELSNKISSLTRSKILLDIEIKVLEADIVRDAMYNKDRWVGGKAPSMSFIESTWAYTGFDGELVKKREELANIVADLELSKLRLELYKNMMDLYRTQSADERMNLIS